MSFDSEPDSENDQVMIAHPSEKPSEQNHSRARIKKRRNKNQENQNEEKKVETIKSVAKIEPNFKPQPPQQPAEIIYPPRKKLVKQAEHTGDISPSRLPLNIKLDVTASNEKITSTNISNTPNIELSDVEEDNKRNAVENEIEKQAFTSKKLTYRVVRDKKISWKGPRTHFQLYCGGIPQYHVKIKTNNIGEQIRISAGNDSHFSSKNFAGYILVDSKILNASLRIHSPHGKEVFNMRIKQMGSDFIETKSAEATVLFDKGKIFEYRTQTPDLLPEGIIKSEIPEVVESIKNMVLEDESNHSRIIIGKIEKSILQITADDRIQPIIIFTIAIILFLCKY